MADSEEHFAIEWLCQYGDKLYSYALSRTGGDTARAEDLVQETLLAGIKGHANFKGKASLETWLIGILRRKIIDYFRKSYRSKELSGQDECLHAHAAEVSQWGVDAGKACESKEFSEVFDKCLSDLSPQLAEAFILSVMDGLSTEEVCSILGITPTNLSVRLHRARLGLREMLQSRWFGSL